MESKNLILIEKINNICNNLSGSGPGIKYPPETKELVQELFKNGVSKKVISEHTPISTFSIRKWTSDIETTVSTPFKRVQPILKKKISFTIKHDSGFSIEVNDLESLSLLLMKIKSI